MKPSERRALREQKAQSSEQKAQAEDKTPTRRQSLWQTYPKLITFIICILVFLIFFGPYNIHRISEMIEEKINEVDDKTDISMYTVYLLADMGVEVSWVHFEKYNYTDISYKIDGKKYIKREYPVGNTGYIIWVGGESTDKSPDYVYLIDFEGTGEVIDIRKGEAEEFVQRTMQQRGED